MEALETLGGRKGTEVEFWGEIVFVKPPSVAPLDCETETRWLLLSVHVAGKKTTLLVSAGTPPPAEQSLFISSKPTVIIRLNVG